MSQEQIRAGILQEESHIQGRGDEGASGGSREIWLQKVTWLTMHADRLVLIISLAAVLAALLVGSRVFENIPHLEDEVAYVWQANVLAEGRLTAPTPDHKNSFLVPFVVDYQGQRFGKYPIGWPLVLAAGIRLGLRAWVNPLLAGLGVWLTYKLGKHIFGAGVGLLAAALTLSSPFFLINSGSLLSHPLGLVLSLVFTLSWFAAFNQPNQERGWLPALTAAFALGWLALSRPFTAVAVAFPFAFHALYLLLRSNWKTRQRLLVFGLVAALIASGHFLWQYAVTGDPLLNPYTLWWDYDRVGFGPGHGHLPEGHSLHQAWINTRHSLRTGAQDLFGWYNFSWLFLPFGLLAARRNGRALLVGSVFPTLVVFYLAYWVGSWLFGPRYYYEGLFSLSLFTAAGIFWLAGLPLNDVMREEDQETRLPQAAGFYRHWIRLTSNFIARLPQTRITTRLQNIRSWVVVILLLTLVSYNLAVFIPWRMQQMVGLYGIEHADLEPFLTAEAQSLTPALVIVHVERWMNYGALLELEDPFLTSPFIFAITLTPQADARLIESFPDRTIIHYDPEEPYTFNILKRE